MNCNIFNSLYHSYRVTQEGKVYSKYNNQELSMHIKNKYHEVLFSMGTGSQRVTQWLRVDHLVASKFILNPNDYPLAELKIRVNKYDKKVAHIK